MNDEKRLPDETVEDVAGGTEDFYRFSLIFRNNNCVNCTKSGKNCPFHDDMAAAYEALDGNYSWFCCPYFDLRQRR